MVLVVLVVVVVVLVVVAIAALWTAIRLLLTCIPQTRVLLSEARSKHRHPGHPNLGAHMNAMP